MDWLAGRTGNSPISLNSPQPGRLKLRSKPSGDGKRTVVDFGGREIAVRTVGPDVVVDGNEGFETTSDRIDVGKVREIERLILDGLVERFNHGIGESNVLLSDDLFNGYFGQLGVLGPRVGEHEGLCGTLFLVDVPTVSRPNRLKLNLCRPCKGPLWMFRSPPV